MADVAIEIRLPNGTMLRLTQDEMRSVYETLHGLMGRQQQPQPQALPGQQQQQVMYRQPDGQTYVVTYPLVGNSIPLGWDGR